MHNKLIYSILMFLFLAGCSEDFLENPPKGQLTSGNFPRTSQDAILAPNAVYNTLREWRFHAGRGRSFLATSP